MTALAADRLTPQRNAPHASLSKMYCLLAVAAVFGGGLVGIDSAGYLRPAAAGSNLQLKIIGVAESAKDNAAGSAGDVGVNVLRGTFLLANSATTDALTQADVGRLCYAVDDQTVARTPALGARPAAGRVIEVTSAGVWVDTTRTCESEQDVELVLLSTGDLSAKQYFFVKQDASDGVVVAGAGEVVLGVVQNAPAAAAMAIVKVLGKTRCIAGAAVVQASYVASGAAGKAKVASRLVQATGAASYCAGLALTAAAGDTNPFELLLLHNGTLGTSDA